MQDDNKRYEFFLEGHENSKAIYSCEKNDSLHNKARSFFMPTVFESSFFMLMGGAAGIINNYYRDINTHISFMSEVCFSIDKREVAAKELNFLSLAAKVLQNPEEYIASQYNIMYRRDMSSFEEIVLADELGKINDWQKYLIRVDTGEHFICAMPEFKEIIRELKKQYDLPGCNTFKWDINSIVTFCSDEEHPQYPLAKELLENNVIIKN